MNILNYGDKIGIVACSNGLDETSKSKLVKLDSILKSIGLEPIFSEKIYKENSIFNGTNKEKGKALMDFFYDTSIKAIFDISGGDLANGVLDYLDYDTINNNNKPFFGYSDLSVMLNGLYTKSYIKTYLYQLRNLIGVNSDIQIKEFKETFIEGKSSLLNFNYEWIQGNFMEGTVIGGNIRCFLKLAGTEYMPDFEDKLLFLESLGGDVAKMTTYLTQYKHLGAFKKVKGIILGTYTEMEQEQYKPTIIELVKEIVDDINMPIIKTNEIGHGQNSKCIIIGDKVRLS